VRVPVLVIGNLIVGGAGKTPTVMAVVPALRRHGFTPGVVSRGYGRTGEALVDVEPTTPAAECGDEPLLMRIRLGVPVVVARDRVAGARALLQYHPGVDVIVSDDGLQHLRLARDAQVFVFDERGVGNGWLLPAGPLREPVPQALPPRSLVLYNAERASTPWPGHFARRTLVGAVPLADWWAGRAATGAAWASLAQRRVVAAAGMAQPERFFAMLRDAGLAIDPLPLPDHHAFTTLPWRADTRDVVVTEKDAVKLDPARVGTTQVWVAPLDFHIDTAFEAALLALLPPPTTRTSDGHPIA
jgi:tetraacyldisaccharide 4'-kinase